METLLKPLFILLLSAIVAIGSTAFVIPKTTSSSVSVSGRRNNNNAAAAAIVVCKLSSSSDNSNGGSGGGSSSGDGWVLRNKDRTDIRNFLTQRSIQSFVYLLNQCREEHTVRWLEKTLDFTSIEKFHGTGAFNQTKFPEWDSVFLDYMDRPDEVIVIQMRQQRRQRKLSGYNSYIESLSSKSSSNGNGNNHIKEKTSLVYSQYVPKMTNIRGNLPGPNSYLESLSSLSSSSSTTSNEGDKSPEIKEKKKEKPTEGNSSNNNKDNAVSKSNIADPTTSSDKYLKKKLDDNKRDIISSGIKRGSISYLETLASSASASAKGSEKEASNNIHVKQSDESSKNPYLEEKSVEYELHVNPSALVRRILSVREQLSKEWVEDLDMLMKLNDEILDTFEDYTKEATKKDLQEEEEDDDDDDDDDTDMKIKSEVDKKDDNDDEDKNSSNDLDLLLKALGAPDAKKDNISDNTPLPSSSSAKTKSSSSSSNDDDDDDDTNNKKEEKKRHNTIFDRNVIFSWSQSLWSPNRSSSPYRKANFDLLLLLATQESIHRVLKSYKDDDEVRQETYEFLLDFYKDHVKDHFDGHQTYARSEDFLDEMLTSSRTLIETKNEILAWVNPARVAEDIVRERSEVALEWMRISETISDEHTDLRRLLFTNMVSKSLPDETLTDIIHNAVKEKFEEEKEEEEGSTSTSSTTVFGAFE